MSFSSHCIYSTIFVGLWKWESVYIDLSIFSEPGPARWCMMYVGVDYCVPCHLFDVTYLLDLVYHTNRSGGKEWIGLRPQPDFASQSVFSEVELVASQSGSYWSWLTGCVTR